jgi:hypothetical protein
MRAKHKPNFPMLAVVMLALALVTGSGRPVETSDIQTVTHEIHNITSTPAMRWLVAEAKVLFAPLFEAWRLLTIDGCR